MAGRDSIVLTDARPAAPVTKKSAAKSNASERGKLRIGDNWNAIRIIALSQSNPLKAVAEFVENSIDAKAKHVTLIRGKERASFPWLAAKTFVPSLGINPIVWLSKTCFSNGKSQKAKAH